MSKTKGPKPPARLADAGAEIVPADPLESRAMIRLAARFQELRRQLFRDAVDTAVEMGDILREGRALSGNRYSHWLEQLGITYATGRNYESLALLAEEQPRILQRFKELGPTKLYRIALLDDEGRKAVTESLGPEKLVAMNLEEFSAVTKPYVKKRRRVTADMRAHGLRQKVRSWNDTLRAARIGAIRGDGLRKDLGKKLKALAAIAAKLADALERG